MRKMALLVHTVTLFGSDCIIVIGLLAQLERDCGRCQRLVSDLCQFTVLVLKQVYAGAHVGCVVIWAAKILDASWQRHLCIMAHIFPS